MNITGLSPIVFNPQKTASQAADDFIASCKGKEMLLEANSRQSANQASKYLDFLIDLNRFEEAYEKAKILFASEESVLAFFAAHLNDPQIIKKHIKNFSLAEDASDLEWASLIIYHDVSGTIDQLASGGQPLPKNRYLKAIIYFLAKDYYAVYSLLYNDSAKKASHELEEREMWFLWMACSMLGFKEEESIIFNLILQVKPGLPQPYFLNPVCAAILATINTSNRNALINYLEEQYNKNPYCLNLIKLLFTIYDEPERSQLKEKLKKGYATYATIDNKSNLITISDMPQESKYKVLLSLYRSNPLSTHLFKQLYGNYKKEPKIKRELLDLALSKSNHLTYRLAEIEYEIEEQAPAELILKKIEKLKEAYPCHRTLIFYEVKCLLKGSKEREAYLTLKEYLAFFGVTQDICEYIFILKDQFNNIDYVITELRKGYEKYKSKKIYEDLKTIYKTRKSSLDYIRFIVEEAIPDGQNDTSDFELIEKRIEIMDDKKEAFLLIDSVPRTAANIKFITWRASFYSEIDPEKAIKDIEFILQYRPTDAAQKLYLRILVNLGRGVEAARIYLSSKLELSKDLIEFMIRNLYCEGEYEWVISIYKKSKIEYSYEMLKLIGLAYKLTNKFEEGIKVYKQLISLNPKDEQNYLDRALFFEALGHIIPAIYVMNEGLGVFPDNEWMKKYKDRLIARQSPNKTPETRVEKPKPAKPPAQIDPKKVTYLIQESTKKDSKREAIEKPKEDKGKKALQKANPHAVDPLKDPLADIKAIAKKGETQTGPKPAAISVPLPVAAAPKSEPPKPIVKVNLRAEEKVFIQKGIVALKDALDMKEALLSQDVVFRNYIYAILRVFTPLRINTTHPTLKNDLKRIRDHARHESDQVVMERLSALFSYLRSISLVHQMQEWMREKSIIHRLMLNNHFITARRPKKTAHEKVVKELEFIIKERGEKPSWEARLYHRNAIKASLSIIGEASNFLSDELKALFADYRQAGNKIAHDFFEDGDTVAFLEKFKEEDISPDTLWELASNAESLLKKAQAAGEKP